MIQPQKNIYITTTTPTSQDTNGYNTKFQITAEGEIVSEYGQESNGLRVLKINDDVQSLPRPSRKGNLANVVKHKPATKATCAKKKKRGMSGVSTKGILCETRTFGCPRRLAGGVKRQQSCTKIT